MHKLMQIVILSMVCTVSLVTCASQRQQRQHRRSQSDPGCSAVQMAKLQQEHMARVAQQWNAVQYANAASISLNVPAAEPTGLSSPPPSPESLATASSAVPVHVSSSQDTGAAVELSAEGEETPLGAESKVME